MKEIYKELELKDLSFEYNGIIYNEEWIDMFDYKGLYRISSFGRIKSHDIIVKTKRGVIKPHKGKILKQSINKRGYLVVGLTKEKICTIYRVNRLVALNFINNNDKEKDQVNHIDCNKLNNHIFNLEWCTNSYNMDHAIKNGRFGNNKNSKIVINLNTGIFYESVQLANNSLSNPINQLHRILKGDRKNKTPFRYA